MNRRYENRDVKFFIDRRLQLQVSEEQFLIKYNMLVKTVMSSSELHQLQVVQGLDRTLNYFPTKKKVKLLNLLGLEKYNE